MSEKNKDRSRPPTLAKSIVASIRRVLGEGNYALHKPRFEGNERKYVVDCINSSYVSSVGDYVDRFERSLESFTGAKHAVAVVNGTAALQVALKLSGVDIGDEVIIPSLTFVATANAVSYLGATPHFADSSPSSLCIDSLALRDWLKYIGEKTASGLRNRKTGRKIGTLVPMHTFGHPCDIEELLKIARDYNLTIVEDASESLGSYYHGVHTGNFGKIGALSFNGNKIITTGGGGAIITNDKASAVYAKHLTTTAKVSHRWHFEHDEIGFNFRMPNLNAALGTAQLESLPAFISSKKRLAALYSAAFADVQHVRFVKDLPGTESNYWLQTLILDELVEDKRDEILLLANDSGFMSRPAWTPMHMLSIYKHCPRGPMEGAESLFRRIINIPSSAGLV